MATDHSEAEAMLQRLAERVHRGWAKQHPMTEKEWERVRAAVQEQWQREEQVRRDLEAARLAQEAHRAQMQQEGMSPPPRDRDKQGPAHGIDKDDGHSH
jgi:hypothetical protein